MLTEKGVEVLVGGSKLFFEAATFRVLLRNVIYGQKRALHNVEVDVPVVTISLFCSNPSTLQFLRRVFFLLAYTLLVHWPSAFYLPTSHFPYSKYETAHAIVATFHLSLTRLLLISKLVPSY